MTLQKSISFALLSILFFAGCSGQTVTSLKETQSISTENYTTIVKGAYPIDYLEYSEGNASNSAYFSDVEHEVEAFTDDFAKYSSEDVPTFDGTMIIATRGTQSNGGYGIEIESVVESDRYVDVTVVNTDAGNGCVATMAITNPFVIALIPGNHKEVRFVQKTLTVDCD